MRLKHDLHLSLGLACILYTSHRKLAVVDDKTKLTKVRTCNFLVMPPSVSVYGVLAMCTSVQNWHLAAMFESRRL